MPGPGRRFTKGQPKPPRSGRAKGTPNRYSAELIDAIGESFDQLGGVAFLTSVAKRDPRTYVALLGRLLPAQVTARAEMEHGGEVVFRWEGENDER